MIIDSQYGLEPEEQAVVDVVRGFVDDRVIPVADGLEHDDTYPAELIEEMKQLGVYGLRVPQPHGEVAVSTRCFALVTEELARGWMSLAGAMGGHSVVASLIAEYGTPEQQQRYLPDMATGALRATMALTEPDGGSDLQAMRTVARPTDEGWVVNGTKTWISNSKTAGLVALLCKTDPGAEPAYRGISVLLVEAEDGYSVSRPLKKLGYRGVDASELQFSDVVVSSDRVLGGEPGKGFTHMMRGLEVGRIQVAARAVGVARAAYEDSLAYAQERHAFGKPIWEHQSISNYLADMATQLTAARALTLDAASVYDSGRRADIAAGMAKLFASEACLDIVEKAVRIHGGAGYSKEYRIERLYRDAPLMVVGEGTNEIQRNVITRQLVARAAARR